jgi:hypothetical protein
MNRQPVQVRAPSVPSSDERPDDAVPLPRDKACSRVAVKQREYRSGCIAWPAVVLGSDGPQRKQFVNIVACRAAKAEIFRQ